MEGRNQKKGKRRSLAHTVWKLDRLSEVGYTAQRSAIVAQSRPMFKRQTALTLPPRWCRFDLPTIEKQMNANNRDIYMTVYITKQQQIQTAPDKTPHGKICACADTMGSDNRTAAQKRKHDDKKNGSPNKKNGKNSAEVSHCHLRKNQLAPNFIPCNLVKENFTLSYSLSFQKDFEGNILGHPGYPKKTQTIRIMKIEKRFLDHENEFFRARRGQGNKKTIGWMRPTRHDRIQLKDITKEDLVREGRPDMTVDQFKEVYFSPQTGNSPKGR
jgi:hypothetical protein